jgi:hypothetical protein
MMKRYTDAWRLGMPQVKLCGLPHAVLRVAVASASLSNEFAAGIRANVV